MCIVLWYWYTGRHSGVTVILNGPSILFVRYKVHDFVWYDVVWCGGLWMKHDSIIHMTMPTLFWQEPCWALTMVQLRYTIKLYTNSQDILAYSNKIIKLYQLSWLWHCLLALLVNLRCYEVNVFKYLSQYKVVAMLVYVQYIGFSIDGLSHIYNKCINRK